MATNATQQAIMEAGSKDRLPMLTSDEWDGQERIDCLYNSSECAVSTTPSTRIVKNEVNDLRAKRLAKITNHLALVSTTQAQPTYYPQVQHTYHNQAPLSLSSPRQTTTTRSPSASHAATRRQGKEIVIALSPPSESNHEDINDEEETQRDKDMQKAMALLFKTFRQIGQNENQRAFVVDGNKETVGQVLQQTRVKCYNCNGLGIWPRSVEQLKGLKIMHIIKKRWCSELEAQYIYMAKIQEVLLETNEDTRPSYDTEPLEKLNYSFAFSESGMAPRMAMDMEFLMIMSDIYHQVKYKRHPSTYSLSSKIKEEKKEAQQKKFLENLKQLHINLPFIEALAQMPKYAKFLKGLLTNKARLEEACTITMNERCSAVLLNKLPSKEKDPGSFTIPCDIGQLHINNALADLGASISLMPYTMYEKLGLGEPKATRMSLELADRSIQYPRGIIENVLIKVDKFVLPIDFVILDMPEDSRVPIILGRPFLATARAMIDVFNKKITLRVGDDEVIFDVDQSIKRPPTEDDECYGVDDLDDTINAEAQELLANEEPDSFLSRGLEKSIDQSDLEGCEPVECKTDNDSDSDEPIRRIASINTPYPVVQETAKPVEVEREHLYSASANEIDEKKPELKDLPHHLEYAYLHGDKSFPIIISSELSKKEKISLLQVLEKRKGAIAWKMSDIKGISPSYCTYKILIEDGFKPESDIDKRTKIKPKPDKTEHEIVKKSQSQGHFANRPK
ncbi:DNA-directed DNA polymerase [Tanacetum coccineum]